jgi:predicted thioredoxin/glutaredoxin
LCENARDVLVRVQQKYDFELSELSIDEDEELLEKYVIDIPVVNIDGEFFCHHYVEAKPLEDKLAILTKEKLQ